MTGEAWTFLAAWAVTSAALIVVLLGAAAKQRDMDKAYASLARKFMRSVDENGRLRRERLTVVHPATRDRMDRARQVEAGNRAGRWDDQWSKFNGGAS